MTDEYAHFETARLAGAIIYGIEPDGRRHIVGTLHQKPQYSCPPSRYEAMVPYALTEDAHLVQNDGREVAWDEGSPCVEPRPVGMVYPPKPAPRAFGYLDGSGVEWAAYDTAQLEAYARDAVASYYGIPYATMESAQ
jgi:hypothetical protein